MEIENAKRILYLDRHENNLTRCPFQTLYLKSVPIKRQHTLYKKNQPPFLAVARPSPWRRHKMEPRLSSRPRRHSLMRSWLEPFTPRQKRVSSFSFCNIVQWLLSVACVCWLLGPLIVLFQTRKQFVSAMGHNSCLISSYFKCIGFCWGCWYTTCFLCMISFFAYIFANVELLRTVTRVSFINAKTPKGCHYFLFSNVRLLPMI